MGRYTQRRRAASGPSPAAPPAPVAVASVTVGAFASATVTFASPVSVNAAVSPNAGFSAGPGAAPGAPSPNFVNVLTPDQVQVQFGSPVSPGDAWFMDSQPNWLLTPAIFPDSGTVA